jgi:hypothetical protein
MRFSASATSRAALDPKKRPDNPSLAGNVAWYLWDRGHLRAAAQCAREVLNDWGNPFDMLDRQTEGSPIIWDPEEYVRHMQVSGAVRAGLKALLAMAAATNNDHKMTREIVATINLTELQGLSSLTVGERAEYHARVAIGLHHAGEPDAAMEVLKLAAEPATTMARRGELDPFDRLCEALMKLLPPEEATLEWAQWLQAAAQSDSYYALGLIASYIRWSPAADVAGIVVNPHTGDLEPQVR